jgi:hypothetical protein
VAFYILYEVYHHEQNVTTTPFEAVVYNSLKACASEHLAITGLNLAQTTQD